MLAFMAVLKLGDDEWLLFVLLISTEAVNVYLPFFDMTSYPVTEDYTLII